MRHTHGLLMIALMLACPYVVAWCEAHGAQPGHQAWSQRLCWEAPAPLRAACKCSARRPHLAAHLGAVGREDVGLGVHIVAQVAGLGVEPAAGRQAGRRMVRAGRRRLSPHYAATQDDRGTTSLVGAGSIVLPGGQASKGGARTACSSSAAVPTSGRCPCQLRPEGVLTGCHGPPTSRRRASRELEGTQNSA
jgi:hypothetical protein